MIEKEIWFRNKDHQWLAGVLHIPNITKKHPAVIICHGFKRDKNQIIPLTLARNLSSQGFVVLRFDFLNCGESQGKFEDLTVTQQIKDTYSAIDFFETLKFVDKDRIGLAGLSLGGGVAVYVTAHDKRIKSLIAFSPRLNNSDTITENFTDEEVEQWRKKGKIHYYDVGRDKYWPMKSTYLEDCLKVNALPLAEKINIPSLLIQGDKDTAVSFEQNKEFFDRILVNKEIVYIKNCDHQYR